MAVRSGVLLMALFWAPPGLAQQLSFGPSRELGSSEPKLELNGNNFALPVIDYRAPDGTWKRGQGIIIGRDISPNATVGIGFFRIKPKYEDSATPRLPTAGKSKKVSLGLSLRF